MAQIDVSVAKTNSGWSCVVTVTEGKTSSRHRVTLTQDYYQALTGGTLPPEELVKRSFQFLLSREPKESILSSFDLTVISRYFPEYDVEIKK